MNRRDRLLKNDNTDKEKQVSNISSDCGVSPETSSPKLKIGIVSNSMISGKTLVGLTKKCKYRFQIKPYGGAISQDLFDHIHPTFRRKPDLISVHIGTNDIANDDCSSLQINLNKIISPST